MSGPEHNPIFAKLGITIFTQMSGLAVEHGAVNLGQGFPDEDGPIAIREAAARALVEGPNQYPPMRGRIELRQALADHATRFHGLTYDPDSDIVVTSGATEALTASIMAMVGPGDEVVLIEPSYDSYRPIVEAVGGVVRSLHLVPPNWRLTEQALRAVFTEKTRVLLINTPMNPIGRVFDAEELGAAARVLKDFDAVAICDEVYEHLTFDGRKHIPLACVPGMAERVLRVGSAGKMFSLTGWKIGWVSGPVDLIRVVANTHQFVTFTTSPALQLGIAHGLTHEMDFTLGLTSDFQARRDLLAAGIARLGFDVLPCEGTYFLTAGIRGLTNESDVDFCMRLVREAGVALIPLSVFFPGGKPDHLVRFAFCKKRATIEEALARLGKFFAAAQI